MQLRASHFHAPMCVALALTPTCKTVTHAHLQRTHVPVCTHDYVHAQAHAHVREEYPQTYACPYPCARTVTRTHNVQPRVQLRTSR
eukprot:58671-Pleurochrysis_carterae.AAC.10